MLAGLVSACEIPEFMQSAERFVRVCSKRVCARQGASRRFVALKSRQLAPCRSLAWPDYSGDRRLRRADSRRHGLRSGLRDRRNQRAATALTRIEIEQPKTSQAQRPGADSRDASATASPAGVSVVTFRELVSIQRFPRLHDCAEFRWRSARLDQSCLKRN